MEKKHLTFKGDDYKLDWKKIEKYVDSGKNLNIIPAGQPLSLLGLSLYYSKYDIAKSLILQGADVNLTYDKNSPPILEVCLDDDIQMLKLLVENGADFNWKDSDGNSLLHHSVSTYSYNVSKFLLEECKLNPNIMNNRRNTPLAVLRPSINYSARMVKIASLLLSYGAEINYLSSFDKSTLIKLNLFPVKFTISEIDSMDGENSKHWSDEFINY